jgi:hypothetical protein
MTCHACNTVLDKPTTIEPTTSVVLRTGGLSDNGAVEIYRCAGCGTQWHRLKPDVTLSGKIATAALCDLPLRQADTLALRMPQVTKRRERGGM